TPLSEAMAAHPRTFPIVVLNLVRAGEASGRLAEVCDEIRKHYEWTDRMAADVRQALMYPVTVLLAVTIFFFVVFTFFIPRFTGVLKELGVPLPTLTRVMIVLSDFMKAHYAALLLGILAASALSYWAIRTFPRVACGVDRAKLAVPFFGPILRQICLSRFVQNLAVLYRAGIPLLEALRLCQPLVGNRVIEHHIESLRQGVAEGHSLHDTMAHAADFPPLVVQMTALGESTGSLDDSLQSVADYYNLIIPREVKKVFGLFEPLMIIGLIGLVGIVALSVFLPIASALEGK
ncbi:MAG: type II secretion system F family protein, partial [Verrucomicrobiales bacterium]|nr:type II secretion system F family protein [Verrucomicrobiales bacterium]